jgi:hypothetical protein
LEAQPDRAPAARPLPAKNSRRLGPPTRHSALLLPIVGGK